MFYKIVNLINNGTADYKGLDINQFIAGSQVYDFTNNVALVKTTEKEGVTHKDLTILIEEDYIAHKQQVELAQKSNQPKSEIDILKDKINLMQKAIDDVVMGGM